MHKYLLGYSESTISRLFDSLLVGGNTDKIFIVKNMVVKEEILFCPLNINYEKVMWDQWQFDAKSQECLLGVTKPAVKKTVYNFFLEQKLVQQNNYTSLFHPSSVIASTAIIGKACFVEPGTVIASFAKLGFAVFVNRGSTIGHHTIIGDYVTINPGVHIAGHCQIGKSAQIGIGTVVFDHIKIGSNTIIGGGSVVTKDIPENVLAWGNPCKVFNPLV